MTVIHDPKLAAVKVAIQRAQAELDEAIKLLIRADEKANERKGKE